MAWHKRICVPWSRAGACTRYDKHSHEIQKLENVEIGASICFFHYHTCIVGLPIFGGNQEHRMMPSRFIVFHLHSIHEDKNRSFSLNKQTTMLVLFDLISNKTQINSTSNHYLSFNFQPLKYFACPLYDWFIWYGLREWGSLNFTKIGKWPYARIETFTCAKY